MAPSTSWPTPLRTGLHAEDIVASLARAGSRVRLEAAGEDRLTIARAATGEPLGDVEVRPGGPGELIVWRLCIEDPNRGYGAGTEAALLLMAAAAEAGWRRLRARAHPGYGLSVYFWIRMGFRPLHGEGPEGGIWYTRQIQP